MNDIFSEEEFKDAFRYHDTNRDGFVTAAELSSMMSPFGEMVTDEMVDEMIRYTDNDGDGQVKFEETDKVIREMEVDGDGHVCYKELLEYAMALVPTATPTSRPTKHAKGTKHAKSKSAKKA